MKTILSVVTAFFVSASGILAGGNTSIVHLSEVHSVKIEPEKITIVGTGYVELRLIPNNKDAKSSVFGQPADLIQARTTRGTFEIIPYFSDPDIVGVPTGGHSAEELAKLSKQWWKENNETYAKVRKGDSIVIGYQEDLVTLSKLEIKKIIGAGTISIKTK
jgi:hypothetical protein